MTNIIKGFWLWLFTKIKPWQKERLAICEECSPDTPICPLCSCFKEAKARVKKEKCPLQKWEGQIFHNVAGIGFDNNGNLVVSINSNGGDSYLMPTDQEWNNDKKCIPKRLASDSIIWNYFNK